MRKLLIANRGEIARRIMRSARKLGLQTVAVHSESDANAAHVADADEAVLIGPAPARESYLRADRIIAVARETGADAVHPGYGFLSESASFAENVTQAGLIWIGAAPDTLRTMGDKERAREVARQAGVPTVPGSGRIAPGVESDFAAYGEVVGYPLLVKASAGGGGIGMRRVDRPDKLAETVTATQSMAAKSFGDGSVFLERYVPRARHVEIQVFGFGDGSAIHLFERDCSLQRRFQKVIEESPAPQLPRPVLEAMAKAAVALCEATRYAGAGTVEFILDTETNEFFFLEMNTRIQVEHPVTEMITGTDLVAMQIDFARGLLKGVDQDDISRKGHAVECRLYAERPEKMFLPSPGKLLKLDMPTPSSDLRIEAAYRAGDEVTSYYDPMLAKIIAHGPDREAACKRALRALRELRVDGLSTNRDFLIACLEDAEFRSNNVHTGFIEENRKRLMAAATEG